MNYQDFFLSVPIPWLTQNTNGQAFWKAHGQILDDWTDYLKQAVKAAYPDYAPSDGLEHLGNEPGLIQGTSSNSQYVTRLKQAWTVWEFGGTALGILLQLNYQGYTTAKLIQQNGLICELTGAVPSDLSGVDVTTYLTISYTNTNPLITGTPKWFTMDSYNAVPWVSDDFTSRFAIVFNGAPSGWNNIMSNTATNGIGWKYGYTTTASAPNTNQMNAVMGIVDTWKPAKATFMGVFVSLSAYAGMIGYPVQTITARNTTNTGRIAPRDGLSADVIYFAPY